MSLEPGTRLGPYEIVSLLGKGGMGEVYEARDTRLGRRVAIKVLPEALSGDERYRKRLEREAQILAAPTSEHLHPPRRGHRGRSPLSGDGAPRGRDARGATAKRAALD